MMFSLPPANRRAERGYSLVEVLVSAATAEIGNDQSSSPLIESARNPRIVSSPCDQP